MSAPQLILIGGSAGSLDALRALLPALPAAFLPALVVVTHRAPDSRWLAAILQDDCPLPVREVDDKDPIAGGCVHVAPADYHLLIDGHSFALSTDDPVLFSRPSIDVTFESAADARGAAVTGIVLTGANRDGAAGLRRIVDRGGRAIVQDPATAEVAAMPAAALHAVPEAQRLALAGISAALQAWSAPAAVAPRPPRSGRT